MKGEVRPSGETGGRGGYAYVVMRLSSLTFITGGGKRLACLESLLPMIKLMTWCHGKIVTPGVRSMRGHHVSN